MSDVTTATVGANILTDFLEVARSLVDECKMHLSDEGITVRAVDPANVAMVSPLTLKRSAFETLEAPGQAVVGVSLNRLADRLGNAKSDDVVTLALDMEKRALRIEYRNVTHHLALIDPESIREEPDNPREHLDLPNSVTLTGEDLNDVHGHADLYGDYIRIHGDTSEKRVRFTADGDIDDMEVRYGRDEAADVVDADLGENTMSMFSLDYWDELASPIPKGAEVSILFGDEFPIIWEWEDHDGALVVTQMCAPRIDSQ